MVTLVAIICAGMLCQDVVVPTQLMVAGKADDPLPVPFTEMMCRVTGLAQTQDYLMTQQQYKGWQITKIMCVPGQYVSNKRA